MSLFRMDTFNEATLADLAAEFWSLNNIQQCQFFAEVVRIAEEDYRIRSQRPNYLGWSDAQWHYMAKDATPEQADAVREITAHFWLHALNWMESNR